MKYQERVVIGECSRMANKFPKGKFNLRGFENFTPEKAMNAGKAAEHFVCYDLLMSGFQAYLSDQGLSYDVIIDTGISLIRVQVKGCLKPKNMNSQGRVERIGYSYSARRRGKYGAKRLDTLECDIIAFVALDIGHVAYLPVSKCGTTMQFSPPDYTFYGKKCNRVGRISDFPIEESIQQL